MRAVVVMFATSLSLPAWSEVSGSVWDGVYTEAQAQRGAAAYEERCAVCHLANLGGNGVSPALEGPQFRSNYDGRTVGDLFDRLRSTMPLEAPGGLSRKTYADILSYIFKANGFSAGERELDHRSEFLKAIRFEAMRPPGTGARIEVTSSNTTPALAAIGSSASSAAKPAARSGPPQSPPADLAALSAANEASGVLSSTSGDRRNAPNSQPDSYRAITGFLALPAGRTLGSTSAVAVDSKGHVWVAERCGANSCGGSSLDPIMEFDAAGKFIKAFGAGMLLFPHGFFIDHNDHIWITDGRAADGKGAVVLEFDNSGKLLRTLGKPGVQGRGPDLFQAPNAVVVAPSGEIFVADGHEAWPTHDARILKFDRNGKFVMQWSGHGIAAGQLDVPHCLSMDSNGRLYVGDRWNNRIQVFDRNGKLLRIFTQFGRPSAMYIDEHDVLYVADSESRSPPGYGYNPGWKRGIRIGKASDGIVTSFIPDTDPYPDASWTSGGEGIWVDASGVIYSAQVQQKAVVKYIR